MLPLMLSYAQNCEDVVLRRVFADSETGFYVDVGASDPTNDSVTRHFYDQGWRGINIEPDAASYAALCAARPRDVTLRAAIGLVEVDVTFYPTGTRGHGTLDETIARDRSEATPETVRQLTLARVLAEHAPGQVVDFLKVDVEGWEAQALESLDWSTVRPRIVLVEAVAGDGTPSHEAWEGRLLAAGYRLGLFDGVNRFYCRDEDAEQLLPRLAAPANVLDNWRLAREVAVQDSLQQALAAGHAALQAEQLILAEIRAAAAETQASLEDYLVRLTQTRGELDKELAAHADTQATLAHTESALAQSAATAAALEASLAKANAHLAAEQTSHAEARAALGREQRAHAANRVALLRESAVHAQTREAAEAARHEMAASLAHERAAHAATQAQLTAKQAELDATQAELAAALSSTSWRVTAPLRDTRRLVRLLRRSPGTL